MTDPRRIYANTFSTNELRSDRYVPCSSVFGWALGLAHRFKGETPQEVTRFSKWVWHFINC